jgi:hypothetical protein
MTYEYTPVLHIEEDLICFLPLQHPAVIKQGKVIASEITGLMAMHAADYDAIKDELDLADIMAIDSRHHVVNRMMAMEFEDQEKLTSTGFGYMYQCFADSGQSIAEILTAIPDNLSKWVEATMEELVINFGIDTNGMNENDIYMAVLHHIESDDTFSLIATYDADGKDWILYTADKE